MNEARRGLLAMLAASVMWGVLALFFRELSHVPPIELLCHRIVWSLLFFIVLLAPQGRLGALLALMRGRQGRIVAFAAVAIAANWFIYLASIQTGNALQSSLGYYIFPLVAVLFGVVFFGERLTRFQIAAVALAVAAVGLLALGAGVMPWMALVIAVSFGLYGAAKKGLEVSSILSVAGEVLVLFPLAALVIGAAHAGWWVEDPARAGGAFGRDWATSLMLVATGPITGIPLILMSYASQRIRLGTLGLIQYVNPTLQFLVATLILGEPFTRWHLAAFALIWTGLALYSWDGRRRDRLRPPPV